MNAVEPRSTGQSGRLPHVNREDARRVPRSAGENAELRNDNVSLEIRVYPPHLKSKKLGGGGGFHGIEEAEELLDVSDGEDVADAIVDADEGEAAAFFIMGDVSGDQGTDTGGVHVGDASEIEDKVRLGVGSDAGLKIEKIRDGEWAGEANGTASGGGIDGVFQRKWLVGHRRNFSVVNVKDV